MVVYHHYHHYHHLRWLLLMLMLMLMMQMLHHAVLMLIQSLLVPLAYQIKYRGYDNAVLVL